MPDKRLADLRRRLALRRKEQAQLRKWLRFTNSRVAKLRAAAIKRKQQIAPKKKPGNIGDRATDWLERRAGWVESPYGSNDSTFLRNWRRALNMGWMRGQPWCGFACLAAYHYAAKKKLPQDTVSTVAIANRARRGDGFRAVPFNAARRGDLVVMHMGSGGPKHVELARGAPRNGALNTVGGNTSPGNGGSQSNGGGIFLRTRSRGLVHTIARPK